MIYQILDIKYEPHHIPQFAEWHHNEWSYLNPGGSIEKHIEKIHSYLGAGLIPSTFIAIIAINDGDLYDGEWMRLVNSSLMGKNITPYTPAEISFSTKIKHDCPARPAPYA